ncbi:MAG: rhomboid family intramembrane serine protease [Muribaculaceae bacterium]|nr:rhomboid family intramembrane serine protease [Muribaculaceae bacterium]
MTRNPRDIYARLLRLCDDSAVLLALLAANAGVSLTVMAVWVICALADVPSAWMEEWLTLPGSPAGLARHPWTLLTYMFTQFHPLHLIFNLLWLFWFGKILLMVMPQRRLLLIYGGGALAGAAAFVITETATGAHGMLTGASAAVMAVMTAAAIRMPDRHIQFLLVGAVRLKWVAGAAVALTFLGIGGGAGGAGALAAHLAGALLGLCLGYARRKRPAPIRREAAAVARALDAHRDDRHRLDRLLDKISDSGYDSLSSREQAELKELSRKL